jgi:ABC-type glycerol-3-phosphate transport system substrate-binding protein
MNMKQGVMLVALAGILAACGGAQAGPRPIATISANTSSAASTTSDVVATVATPITFIEFYAEW